MIPKRKIFFFALLCCLAPHFLEAQDGPKAQAKAEKNSQSSQDSRVKKRDSTTRSFSNLQSPSAGEKDKKALRRPPLLSFKSHVEIGLGDGRKVQGQIIIKAPKTWQVEHEKDGILYQKTIGMGDLSQIVLHAWKSNFMKRKKTGEVYRFEVSRYKMYLKDSQVLVCKKALPDFLQDFVLVNVHGRINLYSYWIDLYNKEGYWHTGMQGPVLEERVFSHKDVIKSIRFM